MTSPTDVTLRDRLGVLRRRKGTILLFTGVVVAVSLAVSLLSTPVYASSARLLLQPRAAESLFDQTAGIRIDPGRAVRNEIEVLKSEPVRAEVRQAIGSAPPVSVTSVGATDVIVVRAEDTEAERAARIANTYAETYIAFRQRQAVEDLEVAGKGVQAKVDEIQRQIDDIDAQINDAPAGPPRDAVRTSFSQQRQALVSTQALFKQRLDQIQVEAPLKSGGAQLVELAAAADEPFRPRPLRNVVLALVLGLLAACAFAYVRDYLDDSLNSKEDLEQATGSLPVVGLLPLFASNRTRTGPPEVPALIEPTSPAAEAYRTLRTSVQFLSLDRPVRTLMITSPNAAEGKTTTIANLGVVFARAGVPVVLVSCDLRRPTLHEAFGLSNAMGFTSVLLGEVSPEKALQRVPDLDRLSVLASGPVPPNPSELLSLRRAADVFTALASHGRLVLVDAPPVLPVSDALAIASRVDAVLMVCSAGSTARKDAVRAMELLTQVDAPLVGTILNGATGAGAYGYPYRYYGYEKPSGRKEEARR